MLTRPIACLTLACMSAMSVTGAAVASDTDYYVSGAGDDYSIAVNANGYVLTSRYPKARFVDQGAASYVKRGADIFYLGKACDAAHDLFGAGRWGQANGGFLIEFDGGFRLGFPRQELPAPFVSNCNL